MSFFQPPVEREALSKCIAELVTVFHTYPTVSRKNGTTLTVVVLNTKFKTLWTANIGDSLALLAEEKAPEDLLPIMLTENHRTSSPQEVARVQACGATMRDSYIVHPEDLELEWPRVIGLTRAIGDLEFGPASGIIATPHLHEIKLEPARHRYLVVASDGLWDVLSPQQVVDLLRGAPADCLERIEKAITQQGVVQDDLAIVIKRLE